MALAKLYRVNDCNGEGWFVAAASFSEAERKFIEWETANNPDPEETTELIDGIVLAGDLIIDGNREESIGHYAEIPQRSTRVIHAFDWTFSNNMSATGTALITGLLDYCEHVLIPEDLIAKIKALQVSIEKYEEIPF